MIFGGDVAWVTGSSSGIGRAIALSLAEEGCNVAIHYANNEEKAREVAEKVEGVGREALLVRGDVSSGEEARRMAGEVGDRFGRLDILVNNAGSMVERVDLEGMTEAVWEEVMDVNLKSVYLVSQAVLPVMKRQGSGRIINLSSISARTGGSTKSIAYSAAEGAVSTMTRTMAADLVSDGILVNAVAPGRIDTPFHDRFTDRATREEKAKTIPLGREGTPEEVAGAVVFLASPAAGYIVGEVVEINGGLLMD